MIPEHPLHADGEVWICAEHKMIGTREQAETHAEQRGCAIERVSDDIAEQVRAERLRRHDEFVAGLMLAARSSARFSESGER